MATLTEGLVETMWGLINIPFGPQMTTGKSSHVGHILSCSFFNQCSFRVLGGLLINPHELCFNAVDQSIGRLSKVKVAGRWSNPLLGGQLVVKEFESWESELVGGPTAVFEGISPSESQRALLVPGPIRNRAPPNWWFGFGCEAVVLVDGKPLLDQQSKAEADFGTGRGAAALLQHGHRQLRQGTPPRVLARARRLAMQGFGPCFVHVAVKTNGIPFRGVQHSF